MYESADQIFMKFDVKVMLYKTSQRLQPRQFVIVRREHLFRLGPGRRCGDKDNEKARCFS